MNQQGDERLIDRHMAGVLRPQEESRLEHLIRTSPEWARRYREAEEMMRLIREGIGEPRAPRAVKERIHRRIEENERRRSPARRHPWLRPVLAAAAVVLLVLGVSALLPEGEDGLLPAVYAGEAWSVKDLARSADVLLVGRTEDAGGTLRLRLERILFGEVDGGAVRLPDGLRPDQPIALFGRHASEAVIEVVGGLHGVIHLDGIQRWDGRDLTPVEAMRLVEQADAHRSLDSALTDLRTFLDSDASLVGEADGVRYSGAVTARFLGRFDANLTRQELMALVVASAKHPEARSAGAGALVEADPLGACRALLTRILQGPVERMHAETEDGLVVLGCLNLIQASGRADLAADLAVLEERLHCPSLVRAARAARKAVSGEGPRTPGPHPHVDAQPLRLEVDGREGIVLPGCEGRREGLLVVLTDRQGFGSFRLLAALAVDRGWGVILLPEGVEDLRPWLQHAADRVGAALPQVVGVGAAAGAAVRASREIGARSLVLVGASDQAVADAPRGTRTLAPADGWRMDAGFLARVLGP